MLKHNFILFTKSWTGVSLPIIQKIFAPILANDFISVQPMSVPKGAVFYMDFKYGVVFIWEEELWWEENDEGEWICPQTFADHLVSDGLWQKELDERLIIPRWEVEQQEQHVGGIGNIQKGYGKVYLDDYTADRLNDGSRTKIM